MLRRILTFFRLIKNPAKDSTLEVGDSPELQMEAERRRGVRGP